MSRPGVMFYFDVRPCLKRLDDASKGKLFEAILDYGEHGIVPELDGMLGVAWDFIQPRVDRDEDKYQEKCENNRKAANVRWEREREKQEASQASNCIQAMPTTTSTSTTNPNPISASKTESKTTPSRSKNYVENYGEDLEARRKDALSMLNALE